MTHSSQLLRPGLQSIGNHTESLWWPLFGWQTFWEFKFANTPQATVTVYWDIVTRYLQMRLVELLAPAFLLWFVTFHHPYLWPRQSSSPELDACLQRSNSPPSG